MGCCCSSQPEGQIIMSPQIDDVEEEKVLRAGNPNRKKSEQPPEQQHQELYTAPLLQLVKNSETTTNVNITQQKEYRLEKLLLETPFPEEFRSEYLMDFSVQNGQEKVSKAIKGTLYFFKNVLYFYCTTQSQMFPYGEFVRCIEKSAIRFMDQETQSVFVISLNNDSKLHFRILRDPLRFIDVLNQLAHDLQLIQ